MAEYSDMRVLDVWYASIDVEKLIPTIQDEEARERIENDWRKPANAACWNMSFRSSRPPPALARPSRKTRR